jgi:hypothetical protein
MTNETTPNPQLNINDIQATVQVIDVVTKRGAFEGAELEAVGSLRNRFATFLNANAPEKQEQIPESAGDTAQLLNESKD